MEANKDAGSKGHTYMVDGKVWIIGEQKISMWSNAKCNQPIKIKEEGKHKDKDKDKDKTNN
jgi:hypothetical protein